MSEQETGRSVSTRTKQEGNKVTTITETKITYADGRTVTKREESTSTGGGQVDNKGGMDDFQKRFDEMRVKAGNDKSKQSPRSGSAASSSPAPQDVPIKEFHQQCLKAHNELRAKHNAPALKLSSELNDYAQKWADHLLKNNKFGHSSCNLGSTRLGENIANKSSSSGADYTGDEVVKYWYSEIEKHNFNQERNSGTGHFTQVVWKGSQELGIGKAKQGGNVIVVGSYRPAGNMIGSFMENVSPPK